MRYHDVSARVVLEDPEIGVGVREVQQNFGIIYLIGSQIRLRRKLFTNIEDQVVLYIQDIDLEWRSEILCVILYYCLNRNSRDG